ncbi:MAG: hypothetical protein WBD22_01745, partial [Pyrinomonadaceae bacterium]
MNGFLAFFVGLFIFSCERTIVSSDNSSTHQTIFNANNLGDKAEVDEVWVPQVIEGCVSRAKAPDSIEIEPLFNPYYLRADLDGNELVDYAILVRSVV